MIKKYSIFLIWLMAMVLVACGMDIDDSLDMAMRLVDSPTMQEKIEQCKRLMLLESKSFAEASQISGLFVPLYCRMLEAHLGI